MIDRRLFLVLAICVACKQAEKSIAPTQGPQLAATVLTIRTTAGEETSTHEILIANGRARSTAEQDVWRLYDTKARTVTFVDDLDKTIRVEPLDSLVRKRGAALAAALPDYFPRAKLTRGETKAILGVNARQHVITSGAYKRELWIGQHRAIPENLFAMMLAAAAPATPLAPMMRDVDAELLRAKGFPLLDRSEVPLEKTSSVVERAVTGIASRQVPEAMLSAPRGYRDLTPKPGSTKGGSR